MENQTNVTKKAYFGIAIKPVFTPVMDNINGLVIEKRKDKILFGKAMRIGSNDFMEEMDKIKSFLIKFGVEEKDILGIYNFLS